MTDEVREMLEGRHEIYLYWDEPRTACSPLGEPLVAHVRLTATVHDCINLQRMVNLGRRKAIQGNDDKLLEDFRKNNWAKVERKPDGV